MFNIILHQPEIPPNTGNIIRLAANTGADLHLVGPLGFTLEDARVRRAGLDYHEMARVRHYQDWREFRMHNGGMRIWAFTTRAKNEYCRAPFVAADGLLFGSESRGLPRSLVEEIGESGCLRLPMRPCSRSLNLSNAVAIVLYEALRQNRFPGLE